MAHGVETFTDGDGLLWVDCGDCLFREGPYTDEFDAELSVLWHREITTPPDLRPARRPEMPRSPGCR